MTYRNKTNLKMFVPGVGDVEPNATFETELEINNSNFELVSDTPRVVPAAPLQPLAAKQEVTN